MSDDETIQHDQHEELTAYLDGELDAESVRRVEDRLAHDEAYQRELRHLERAWTALDQLPRAALGEKFTKTTMEMVALNASQEAEAATRDLPRRLRRQRIWAAACMAGALLAGFVLGKQLWRDPNRPLLEDLPVLENLDLYYQADDIDFLKRLDRKGWFSDGDAELDAPAPEDAAPATGVAATRRDQVAALSESAQQELLRKFERFSAMPADEQQRLRKLQADLSADAHAARLHLVLERYHEWLKTITASQRAELAELAPEQRVEQIGTIQHMQRAAQHMLEMEQQAKVLSKKDAREITRWVHDLVNEHRSKVLAAMSPQERARFDKNDDPSQKQRWLMYRTFRGHAKNDSRVTQRDIDRLAAKLSDDARAELDKSDTLDARRRIVGAWIFATDNRSESRFGGRRVNPLVGEELFQFLQNEVPPARREELLKMPREEMLRELRKMYFERGGDRRMLGPPSRRRDSG